MDPAKHYLDVNQKHREDIIPEDNFIQCSFLKMNNGKTFPAHKHIKKERHYQEQIAQESWIVIKGKVKAILYDLDDTIISEEILYPGDASFTLEGGHTYEILEDDTVVYEYKTGPYEGQEFDKVFL
jgi:hypothetical protein